jgi:carbonic anhydrase
MTSTRPLNPNSASRSNLTVADLVARNDEVMCAHRPAFTLEESLKEGYASPPILILTCADLRCVPEHFFNMKRGEAVIIRAIGGRVLPNLSAILLVDSIFEFKEFVVVHHTDCGITHIDGLRELLRSRALDSAESEVVFDGLDRLETKE